MNDDDKSLIKDITRMPGWVLIKRLNSAQVEAYRRLATQRGISREDREWYSALAIGREELFEELEQKGV